MKGGEEDDLVATFRVNNTPYIALQFRVGLLVLDPGLV